MVQEKINESRRFNKSFKMPRRTYEKDAQYIVVADDLDEIVKDKRLRWRADSSKANQRQRRYKKRLTKQLINISSSFN